MLIQIEFIDKMQMESGFLVILALLFRSLAAFGGLKRNRNVDPTHEGYHLIHTYHSWHDAAPHQVNPFCKPFRQIG
jgi:hypothetical protein